MFSRKIIAIGAFIVIGTAVSGAAIYAGMLDPGTIDINGKIEATDQTGYETPVNTNTRATLPNGGLRGKGKSPVPPPSPEPSPEEAAETVDGETPSENAGSEGAATTDEQPVEQPAEGAENTEQAPQ